VRFLRPLLPLLACFLSTTLSWAGERTAAAAVTSTLPAGYCVGETLISEEFDAGLALWRVEAETGARVEAAKGGLEIDVPGGCSVWLTQALEGPVLISYEATAISAGGPNDRVSDLNCFWMATDARNPADLFAVARSGAFADYDQLRCYYVGLGANANSTTRFRRYIGRSGNRPLLPEHDLRSPESLLVANQSQLIQLVAAGDQVAYYRDGRPLFSYQDPEPYRKGYFAFRTVKSHFLLKHFRVQRLCVVSAPVGTSQ